jgi:hypothetical protein
MGASLHLGRRTGLSHEAVAGRCETNALAGAVCRLVSIHVAVAGWGRLGAARKRRRPDPADEDYLAEEATAPLRWIFSAADSISSTTASG